ncbi:uroporphyrinogen-III synthase [Fodinibius sediminis]|uniref:Uroporphyrinogen-III synthase n=1 Tax=Fodinibius sediminis TaxID=1214077 RepID=A0A521C584_9BACT|nr:uroporphyrinogen-III synthase [Fodinibius sediminis]SMO54578.1 Uroporphyrinogen-III synthase [Fodinibius sediminis]
MSLSVLLTAAEEDAEQFCASLAGKPVSLLHHPLERYEALGMNSTIRDTLNRMEDFENIVHGSKRNARFFIEKLKELNKLKDARQQLNLALNQPTADYLEEENIPAIHPRAEGKAINLMEFMLRVRRLGTTLYPCGDKTSEDLPGLLQELDIPVEELVLFRLEGPREEELQQNKNVLQDQQPEVVLFHSRRSVNRTRAAFPDLDYDEIRVISGDQAVTDKLEREGIPVDRQAAGSWESLLEELEVELPRPSTGR